MDFPDIHIRNFLTVGDSGPMHLMNRGLNLLQGENKDDTSARSNGSGKSTLPDAFCWLFYDITARGESGDAVVNNKTKKDTHVFGTVLDGATLYRVNRYRKHHQFKNELHVSAQIGDGAVVDLTKGTVRETQAELERILGCSYAVFKAAIYAGQEDMPDLPKMTDKQLKMLIEEAAGTQRLEAAYVIASKKENALKGIVNGTVAAAQQYATSIHSYRVDIEGAKLRHAAFEAGRENNAAAHDAKAAEHVVNAQQFIAQAKALDEPTLNSESLRIRTELDRLGSYTKAVSDHDAKILPVDRARSVKYAEAQRVRQECVTLKGQHENAHAELAKPCDACGKPHTADELDTLKGHIKERLLARLAVLQGVQTEVTALDAQLAILRDEKVKLIAAVPDSSALLTMQREVDAKLQSVLSLKSAAQREVTTATAKRDAARTAKTEANPHQSAIELTQSNIARFEALHATAQATLVTHTAAYDVAKVVSQVFGPAGVRAHILDAVTPFLNERTADYLGILSDGNLTAVWSTLSRTAKGELREKFSIDVKHAKGGDSFGLISGGEKRKVRLATVLALQDLVASRATKSLRLWMGDEIDDALDEPGLERLMTILERKAREKGTVIVISHRSLTDWVDNVTTITKQHGKSFVEGSLCMP